MDGWMLAGSSPTYDLAFVASFVDFIQKFLAAKNHFLCVAFSQKMLTERRLALIKAYKQFEMSVLQNHFVPKLCARTCAWGRV